MPRKLRPSLRDAVSPVPEKILVRALVLPPCQNPNSYAFSTVIGSACARQMRTYVDLAEKLGMDVHELMRECKGEAPPSRAVVQGLARELHIDESYLEKLAGVQKSERPQPNPLAGSSWIAPAGDAVGLARKLAEEVGRIWGAK
jgi:transcriptional regulator with XRE-family HTH domain